MNKAMLTVVLTGVAAVSFGVSGVAFAGNAHGAATAGMTYQGDPASSPWTTKPAGWTMGQRADAEPAVAGNASENVVVSRAQAEAQ
ncbi:hypothetical protein [Paraburkholderia phenazinium]|uniref:Uncharacterized protein n=1 Tax=Paraburkholderia phenazinium TaxID=60549 RepID=A0A1N6JC58_9BURK|nr:hypothetical protein [Paraburkholderia phenazinium]SIO41870.1 hypothetical protein SAMN05444168_4182 [Paraburkholderia phenazinium]